MSDMKCPICNKPMKEQIDGTCISYQETDCICNIAAQKLIWKEMAAFLFFQRKKHNIFTKSMCMEKEFAEEECKRLQAELERTRKALEIAVDALKLFDSGQYTPQPDSYGLKTDASRLARKTLEQITALEQKETAFVHNKTEFPEYNDGLLEEFDKQFFENGQDDDLTETALEQKDVK